jgi:ABC-type uncharacterized transport system permease subunit
MYPYIQFETNPLYINVIDFYFLYSILICSIVSWLFVIFNEDSLKAQFILGLLLNLHVYGLVARQIIFY